MASANPLSTLVGLYTAPTDTFRAVATRPAWVLPFLGLIVLNLAFTAEWVRHVDAYELSRAQFEEAGVFDRIPADRHAEAVQQQADRFKTFVWVGPLVFGPLAYTLLAAVFLFVYRFFYESETTFAQAMAVVFWTFFAAGLVMTPVTLAVLFLKGDWNVDPRVVVHANLGALVDKTSVPKPLFALLSAIDLFSIWIVFLLSAGFAAVANRTVRSAAWGVIALWLGYVFFSVVVAFVF
jgi:hypothetical protein